MEPRSPALQADSLLFEPPTKQSFLKVQILSLDTHKDSLTSEDELWEMHHKRELK